MTAIEMITTEMDRRSHVDQGRGLKSIVVATDGSECALAAFKAASLIAGRNSADVHVISVLEPLPTAFSTGDGLLVAPPNFYQSREDAQRAIIREQTAGFDPDETWTMSLRVGRPAETIVAFAHDQSADLIVVGANSHGVVGRIFGEETALEIARLSDIPLLIASSTMNRLPRRIVVAMDLDAEGLQSAPEAVAILADTPSISCAHVKPRAEFLGIDWATYDGEYELAMRKRFANLETDMNAVNLRPDLIVLHGDAARELVEFGGYCKAELMVVGVRRRRGRARSVGGRIAGRVIRQSPCSVLVVPRTMGAAREAARSGATTNVINDPLQWGKVVRSFSERNTGRPANLEVDDPELGALVEASNYPLRGVDYDHRDGRLTISLGYTSGTDRHLTRSIEHPESVSVLSVNGRDSALSVAHGGGQTLLTF